MASTCWFIVLASTTLRLPDLHGCNRQLYNRQDGSGFIRPVKVTEHTRLSLLPKSSAMLAIVSVIVEKGFL